MVGDEGVKSLHLTCVDACVCVCVQVLYMWSLKLLHRALQSIMQVTRQRMPSWTHPDVKEKTHSDVKE